MSNKNFQYHLSNFLTKEMPANRNNSYNTISSYATAFKLFLEYMEKEKKIKPNKVNLSDITRDNIINFLNWMEENKHIQVHSRNVRLAAIRSFVNYLQCEDVEHIFEYQKILSIKNKKSPSNEVMWISKEQMKRLLNSPSSDTKDGFKDKVLLTVLYDSGARVDELIHMKLIDIHLEKPASIKIKGKGNKIRVVPIMGNTVELLKKYIKENDLKKRQFKDHPYLFQNRSGNPYTRAGIAYIINKYVEIVNSKDNTNITVNMHPHVFRHSKAVHLLESGIELIYIRDFLGHSSVKTTEIYAKVCTQNKIDALEKVYENASEISEKDWTSNKNLMDWLANLAK